MLGRGGGGGSVSGHGRWALDPKKLEARSPKFNPQWPIRPLRDPMQPLRVFIQNSHCEQHKQNILIPSPYKPTTLPTSLRTPGPIPPVSRAAPSAATLDSAGLCLKRKTLNPKPFRAYGLGSWVLGFGLDSPIVVCCSGCHSMLAIGELNCN